MGLGAARMGRTASRIIAKYGQAATFERSTISQDPRDPVSPPTFHPATVAIATDAQLYGDRRTLIQSNDLKALVSIEGLDIVPKTSDGLTVGGVEYTVLSVTMLAPDGVTRFFELKVSR